jgi:putative two-component system response regulator
MILPSVTKQQTLFVVDDSDFTLSAMNRLLSKDYKTLVFRTGDEALEKIKDIKPDLVLLDVMMPGLNGIDICYNMKSDDETKHIPIIFITAISDPSIEEHCLKIGADDFIIKPFHHNIFLLRIKNVLKRGIRQ